MDARPAGPPDQDTSDSDWYLFGRLLVLRQEHLDLNDV
jgi:hypothetical protein